MRVTDFQYDLMIEDALRGVVRRCLRIAATQGLPGAHHFYITFKTHASGVSIPSYLKARYPDEMTIVLQHQYWNLEVTEDFFSVTLSFSDKLERLIIPFVAVTSFADPSSRFGLQFEHAGDEDEDDEADAGDEPERPTATASVAKLAPAAARIQPRPAPAPKAEGADGETSDEDPHPTKPDGDGDGAKVVALDRFRRK